MDDIYERPDRSRYAAAITEDLLIGERRLRNAFLRTPLRSAGPRASLIAITDPNPPAILLRNGFAFRSCYLTDGRRAILHLLIADDFAGLDHAILDRPVEEIVAVGRVAYHALSASEIRELMSDRSIAMTMLALSSEARWRSDRLAASIGRLDAEARICVLLLDIHNRLYRQGVISRATYNLPLTQEQIADHLGLTLVHVNRTLRRLREERVVLFDRGVVMILKLDRLRQMAQGLPQPAELPARDLPTQALTHDPTAKPERGSVHRPLATRERDQSAEHDFL